MNSFSKKLILLISLACSDLTVIYGAYSSGFSYQLQNRTDAFLSNHNGGNAVTTNVIAMFCDIKNILNICAQTELVSLCMLTKLHFEAISEIVRKYSGTINKYTSRSVFAVFPARSKQSYENAVCCAMAILAHTQNLSDDGVANIECCIGIDCGLAARGILGGRDYYEETYIGDVINSASRLQTLSYGLNTRLAVSNTFISKIPQQYQALFDAFNYQWVKGKTDSIQVFGLSPTFFQAVPRDNVNKINRQKLSQLLQPPKNSSFMNLKLKKYVSLFCDIRNFTSYCEESSARPDIMFKFLQAYFDDLTTVISKYNGIPSKYLGDGILVIFPIETFFQTQHVCMNSIKCAEEFLNIAKKYMVQNGVGISMGGAVAMDVGVRSNRQYNSLCNNIMIGATIRTAFWLEDLNKNKKIAQKSIKQIVISSDVYHGLPDEYQRSFKDTSPGDSSGLTVYCYAQERTLNLPPIRVQLDNKETSSNDEQITNSNFSTDPKIDQMISAGSAAEEY